ncbi:MAG: metalloregulator ArsR/SmtB family transcription factor [Candidatus Omnitrophota bacterium]|jgi:ArsR family transcriptional regulator
MSLKTLRQIFKACAEDTRLRILNILNGRELTVKEICSYLGVSQPAASKHLSRLRLLRIVIDRREGNLVYYGLNLSPDLPQRKVVSFIISQFKNVNIFKKDNEAMRNGKKKKK